MSDFDFDELDKAVNKLATKVTGDADDEKDTSHVTVTDMTPARSQSMPIVSSPDRPKAESSSPSIMVKRPPIIRSHSSRKAFMDIVPPTRQSAPRGGIKIEPLGKLDDVMPTKLSEAPRIFPARQAEPHQPELAPKHKHEATWPDPLDFHPHDPLLEEPPESLKLEATNPPEDDEPEADKKPANERLQTPFLADAKVEKRPLGAYAAFTPELQPSHPELPHSPAPDIEALDLPVLEPTSESITFNDAETRVKSEDDQPAPSLHDQAMMAIPKQYHSSEKHPDNTKRPIFDTKEYHPPLASGMRPERKGSRTWLTLLIALVVAAIIGVCGYITFLYMTQV